MTKQNLLTVSKSIIIPAILTTDKTKFSKQLDFARIKGTVHLDVIDGSFCGGESLQIEDWPEINVQYSEAHLMVKEPISYLEKLAAKKVRRVIVHVEASFDLVELRDLARRLDLLLGYAINPDTDLFNCKSYFEPNSYIQLMGVVPGHSGQEQVGQIVPAIRYVQQATSSRLNLSVDGGVNSDNIPTLINAGANFLVAGSAIYGDSDFENGYQQLLSATQNS